MNLLSAKHYLWYGLGLLAVGLSLCVLPLVLGACLASALLLLMITIFTRFYLASALLLAALVAACEQLTPFGLVSSVILYALFASLYKLHQHFEDCRA